MSKLLNFFGGSKLRLGLAGFFLFVLCVTRYRVIFGSNYNLYWTYIFEILVTIGLVYLLIYKKGAKRDISFWQKMKTNPLILLTPIFILLAYQLIAGYNSTYSSVKISSSTTYEFEQLNYFLISDFSKPASGSRIRELDPDFAQSLIKDLSYVEGRSIGIIRGLNQNRLRAKFGEPVELLFPYLFNIQSQSDISKGSPVTVHSITVYPNDMAFVKLGILDHGIREFPLYLSDETLTLLKVMLK